MSGLPDFQQARDAVFKATGWLAVAPHAEDQVNAAQNDECAEGERFWFFGSRNRTACK